jgi:hypothetical protein
MLPSGALWMSPNHPPPHPTPSTPSHPHSLDTLQILDAPLLEDDPLDWVSATPLNHVIHGFSQHAEQPRTPLPTLPRLEGVSAADAAAEAASAGDERVLPPIAPGCRRVNARLHTVLPALAVMNMTVGGGQGGVEAWSLDDRVASSKNMPSVSLMCVCVCVCVCECARDASVCMLGERGIIVCSGSWIGCSSISFQTCSLHQGGQSHVVRYGSSVHFTPFSFWVDVPEGHGLSVDVSLEMAGERACRPLPWLRLGCCRKLNQC